MTEDDPLTPKMRRLAEVHPRGEELRKLADQLDEAVAGAMADPPTKTMPQMLGAWARARRVYCDCSGEPLI